MIATSEDPDTLSHGRLGYGESMETVGATQGRGQCCVKVCVMYFRSKISIINDRFVNNH